LRFHVKAGDVLNLSYKKKKLIKQNDEQIKS